jgi:hypothetical protein
VSQPSTCRRLAVVLRSTAVLLLLLGASLVPAWAGELGSATLQIAGTRLSVSPIGQTVPFDTPTLVETHLEGYDAGLGALPADLEVLGDFSGPGIEGVVQLSTSPNEPFRIPRLRVKGAYALSNIRLVQDGEILGYGDPRSVSINATQILVSSVSARPLTQDEIDAYGIVLDRSNFQALSLTFGFAVEGRTFNYQMPLIYQLYDTDGEWNVPFNEVNLPMEGGTTLPAAAAFVPPRMAPFALEIPELPGEEVPAGGCDPKEICRESEQRPPRMVGVILFPTELSLLHQFFSVVLMVQNGAPDGDPLEIHDLTAKMSLPSGLRAARTEPPTPLGVPVPLRVPGPDGEVGTADDVTFLIAQAAAEAEFLVEGLREGTHLVNFDLAGTVHGMPGGPRPVSGRAQGAVVVRDPTLSVTIAHPKVVRAQEEYSLHLTVTNLGKAPVNQLDVGFKVAGLAGTQVVGDATKEIGNLLPGDTQVVEFAMRALVTGRVVSSSARAGSSTRPGFELTVGVANGIPLSPETLVLPNTSNFVPDALYKEALGLIGLAYSLAEAPPSLVGDKAQATKTEMNDRVYRLSQLGRQIDMGEEVFDAAAAFAAEWLGARDGGWEWDRLRRTSNRGKEVARALGELLAEEQDGTPGVATRAEAFDIVERLAATAHYLSPIVLGAHGAGVELEIRSRTSGKEIRAGGAENIRELPFAELYPLDADARLGMVARAEEGGYEARLRRQAGAAGDLGFELVLPSPSAEVEPTRYVWPSFSLPPGAVATLVFDQAAATPLLSIDDDGDGEEDRQSLPTVSPLERRPFTVVLARLDLDHDPSGHVVDLLFSADLDLESIAPRDPDHFRIDGRVSNGGLTQVEASIAAGIFGGPGVENPLEGLFNPRIVRVAFNNPINPHAAGSMLVADLLDAVGREFGEQEVEIALGGEPQLGATVVGQVIDPYGQPLPYAEVSLFQRDLTGIGDDIACARHRTARTTADAEGRYRFDYVRQTDCGKTFDLEALDPAAPFWGIADGVVRYPNSEMTLNVVMLGRATVRGRVTYSDGSVPPGLKVLAHNRVFNQGRLARVEPNGDYRMEDVVVGTVTLYAYDELGNKVYQTIEVPSAGSEVVRDLVILRQTATSAAATVRGRVLAHGTGAPSPGTYVLLTLGGQELGVKVSDSQGEFDFGTVPIGAAELTAYLPATGRVGAKLALQLAADQNAFVDLQLRDDRGRFVGYVKRVALDGNVTPVADAVVWVDELPFNTRTDANGYYELEDVLTGSWRVKAADLPRNQVISQDASVTVGQDARVDIFFRDGITTRGAITGTVYGVDGAPVRNAGVVLSGDEWSVRYHHQAYTDSSGRFRIDNLDPGVYGVHSSSGDDGAHVMAEVRYPGDVADVGIRYVRARIRGRTFTRDADGNVFGVISRIKHMGVKVMHEWGGIVVVARDFTEIITEDDGTFVIDALPGPMHLIASNVFHGGESREYVLSAIETVADIEFERNGSIQGVVYDHDGVTPVPGVELKLSGGLFGDYTIHSDENGAFDFALLPPGGYGIAATDQRGGVLRQGFSSVVVRRFGDVVKADVRLPRQGTVFGQVFDADWNPVPNVAVTLHGDRYPRQVMTQNTDADGRFAFTNVYAGDLALVARAPELGGLGGKAMAQLGMEGEEVATEIQLEGVGELTGVIIDPDDNQPVPNAEVKLEAIGISLNELYFFTLNADFEGRFRFDRLPLRTYRVYTFDPSTGRRAVSDWHDLEEHGQVVDLRVELEVRGTVDGHLYNQPSGQTVPGVTIKLEHSGMVRFDAYSSTDIDGYFEFGGIPEGNFRLETFVAGRRAQATGAIQLEDEVVTRDLHLEALARIEGLVRRPRTSAGESTELAENVNVLVRRNGQVVAASTDNPFLFDDLLPGNYDVEAREIDGDRRVFEGFRLVPGESKSFDLELRGILSAQIHVFESNGQPVAGGLQVKIGNRFKFVNRAVNGDPSPPIEGALISGTLAEGNTFEATGIRQGTLDVSVIDPVQPSRKGTAWSLTGYDGDTTHVNVQLGATGKVCGLVYLADGATPAAGATVAIKPVNEGYRLAATDEAGNFCFDILPRTNFRIDAQEKSPGLGSYTLNGSWATSEYDKSYTIVLDDTNPTVVSISPAHNATGVPLNAPVVVTFSEPVCRTCGGIWLNNSSGWTPPVASSWSADSKVLTMTAAWASNTGYRVMLRRPLQDLSGRQIAYEVISVFQTADVVPPRVVEVVPAANLNQVPVATTIKVTFSEPIDPNLQPGNFALVRLDEGGYAETLIPLVIAENRRVSLTVTPDLETDHHYELRVQGIRDTSGNVMVGTFTSRFHTFDTTLPEFTWTRPAEGQLFKAGDKVALEGVPTDDRGVAWVEYELGGRKVKVSAAPWKAEIRAPIAAPGGGPVVATALVEDIFGNRTTVTRNLVVEPQPAGSAPFLGAGCPADGDWVARGVQIEINVPIEDEQAVDSWELRIDGQLVKSQTGLEAKSVFATYAWKPAATVAPGTAFELQLSARDFADQVTTRTFTVTVPLVEPLKSGRPLLEGETVLLGAGTFSLPATTRTLAALTLLQGAQLTAADGSVLVVSQSLRAQCGGVATLDTLQAPNVVVETGAKLAGLDTLRLAVSSKLTVEAGAVIDVTGKGYPGGVSFGPQGAPAGVVRPVNAGGSHGGVGSKPGNGTHGEVYDSVYRPQQGGGGGYGAPDLAAGGGVIEIEAGEVELEGRLLARGLDYVANQTYSGAGGSVFIVAEILSGSGLIDVSGGENKRNYAGCFNQGAGGGGRIGLRVNALEGFDPSLQAVARGGESKDIGNLPCGDGGPGTIYVKTAASTYGDLLINAVALAGGADRPVPATPLPALGAGAPSSLEAAAGDLWMSRAGGFPEAWLGAWVELLDGSNVSLGVFEAAGRDGAGRLRLTGAGALTGVASYQGRYRFDAVTVKHGAGLQSADPVESAATELAGAVEISGPISATNLKVKAGAVVSPASGASLILRVSGKLTVEAGAVIDVSGRGYAGGHFGGAPPQGPPGVVLANVAGGSHGGQPDRLAPGYTSGPRIGEVYDSVYRPQMLGGGAAMGGPTAGAGGGVIDIEAGELVLDGELRSRGNPLVTSGDPVTGAGGSILVVAQTLSGSGQIDAGGGIATGTTANCKGGGSVGGGGRVSLLVGELDLFDPELQARAPGGRSLTSTGTECVFQASPGTVYVKTAESIYGDLSIDAVAMADGSDRAVPATPLPSLGSGSVAAMEAAGEDAWISRAGGFAEAWLGVWVELTSAGPSSLGVFEVKSRDAAGRLLLRDAGSLTGIAGYRGIYRFDSLSVRHGAGVVNTDTVETGHTVLSGDVPAPSLVTAQTLTVKAGAVVRPASGGSLKFRVTGRMTVEAGAVLDVSGKGYAGGDFGGASPQGPPGVILANVAGGSHGGQPDRLAPGYASGPRIGEVYDSVYRPQMLGGGAAMGGPTAGAGGGVIEIEAGELVLDGELRSRGNPLVTSGDPVTGAGGSILVVAQTLSGSGQIDAGGGIATGTTANCKGGGSMGGGGRVGLLVGELDGFDPELQAKAPGGRSSTSAGVECAFQASPGTVYVKTAESTYGDLILDAVAMAGGADRAVPSTRLPELATGASSAWETAGADAWISRTGGFAEKWHGAWIELLDLHGGVLGIFEAVERDAAGRLRLASAGDAAGVTGYRGVYRFDRVVQLHGAALGGSDPVELGTAWTLGRSVRLAELRAPALTIPSGVTLGPDTGKVRLVVPGTVTVSAGGKIDLDGAGYAGNTAADQPAGAPAGIAGSVNSGGSHGGGGDTENGVPGPVYDSVYRPSLGGGGGNWAISATSSRGGGVLELEAGSLVLDGQILARGDDYSDYRVSAGAGGSVRIAAAQLAGSGSIDTRGGNQTGCSIWTGGGGGGRVALDVADLTLFDPATKVSAYAGITDCGAVDRRAAAGTVYVKTAGSTFGTLRVDAGRPSGSADRVRATRLPSLGGGAISSLTASAGDAWLAGASSFPEAWLGVWVELKDAAGVSLGVFEATRRDGAGRLFLSGASGAVATATTYRGYYRFDQIITAGGAGVAADEIYGQPMQLAGEVRLDSPLTADRLTLAAGATVKPYSGTTVALRVAGELRIEAGARIDVSGTSTTLMTAPLAPAGAGGSHGGSGDTGDGAPGGVYDSVYLPQMAGSTGHTHPYPHELSRGGGVIDLEAGSLVLDGELLASGTSFSFVDGRTAGSGGTVKVTAGGAVSGTGRIEANGGTFTQSPSGCHGGAGAGGGGRVAISAGAFAGFDPPSQVRTWGGVTDCSGTANDRFAAPGTLFYRGASSTWGNLLIDAGESWNGAARAARATRLPLLGSGAPSSFTAAGGDAWLAKSGGFAEHWLGVYVELYDADGVLLGTFPAAERNGAGALRLAGAGGAGTVAGYRGSYRFDEIKTLRGAGLEAGDPLHTSSALVLDRSGGLAELHAPTLEIKSPAVVKPVGGAPIDLHLTGALTLESGASLDASGAGFAGTTTAGQAAGAPAGIAGSVGAGGSYGGEGDTAAGTAGPVYGSVYRPRQAGGGGNRASAANLGRGGGVIQVAAGSVALGGQILAKGDSHSADGYSAGAGGTISIATAELSGAGLVDASGGTQTATGSTCVAESGGGGGGRVAILAGALAGFDPATQARAWAGRTNCPSTIPDRYAAAGTVYAKTAGATYGSLRIDAGLAAGSTERVLVTNLPTLGGGALAATAVAGGDLWISASPAFSEAYAGVWVSLLDAGGNSLGLFEAAGRDAAGRLRLTGAGAVTGMTAWQAFYRFDQVDVVGGGGFYSSEMYSEGVVITGNAAVDPVFTASDLTIKAGATLKPNTGSSLSLRIAGTLRIEAGATIDVSAIHAGLAASPNAPANAGGGHGGHGDTGTGTAGGTFDSVYRPTLPGSAGQQGTNANNLAGGVIDIEANAVILNGQLLAKGASFSATANATGAGGTLRIKAASLSGSGSLDASGGNLTLTGSCAATSGAGGGGRVSLEVANLAGFDPHAQVKTWAGVTDCTGTASDRFAGAGTLFYKNAAATYGTLVIDAGDTFNGVTRAARPTVLPALGSGAPSSLSASGGDAWLARSGNFGEHWLGAWVELRSSAGVLLGTYEAVERTGGALRLAGAAGAAAATQYRGIYRFDEVKTLRGGGLSVADPLFSSTALVLGTSGGLGEVHAPSLRLMSPAVVKAPAGKIDLQIDGTLTVDAGAALDAGASGYLGTTGATAAGAPAGIAGSINAGGSHGGIGDTETGTAGAVYDSVYRPQLGGGGGNPASAAGLGRGGGVIHIAAGAVSLGGQILAKGESHSSTTNYSAGAGGTIRIVSPQLSGSGSIDAGGGTQTLTSGTCSATTGGGGGGRIALEVATFSGFDPALQAKAGAGRTDCPSTNPDRWAAAGTLYVKTTGSTWGTLHVDGAAAPLAGERLRATTLPALGAFAPTAATAEGGDLWVQAASAFPEAWLGVFVELENAGGTALGVFEVVARDAAGRLKLGGAAAHAGAATAGRGFYRFDQVLTRGGAGFQSSELYGQGTLIAGNAAVDADFYGGDLSLAAGTTLRPASGSRLSLHLTGNLTVGAGATIDVSTSSSSLPAGIAAPVNAGGSHGGRGDSVTGTQGAVFDSIYRPQLSGGAGNPITLGTADGRGGGLLEIDAAGIVLDGQLLARGGSFSRAAAGGAGAGGTVRISAAELSGSGLIDASGGVLTSSDCTLQGGGGGGGRVALAVADLAGFTVDSQVRAWGGVTDCSGTANDRFAAAGTVYVADAAATYGRLLVDGGESWEGAPRKPVSTKLPALGQGAPSSLAAAGGDAWLARSGGFAEHWWGVWVELRSAGGSLLGTFRAVERDAAGKLRLAGAAGAVAATSYTGIYRFDAIDTVRGGYVDTGEPGPNGPVTLLEGTMHLASPVTATNVLVRSNAILKPASGTALTFRVSGTMTVEAGAKIDVAGISAIASGDNAGGSHGGTGDNKNGTNLGATYDSVYRPQMAGGRGSRWNWDTPLNRGGGVIDIEAASLVLDGALLANAPTVTGDNYLAAAGGAVRIKAGQLAGSGTIDASGGDLVQPTACWDSAGGGGGGRVALDVADLTTFDLATQVKAWAGVTDCPGTGSDRFAAAGTIYYRTTGSTYGTLLLDAGPAWGGVARAPRPTKLPQLGNGNLTSLTASGSDAWLVKSGGFAEHWHGTWIELRNAGGTLLGTFEVKDRDNASSGRLLLAGASGAVGSATTFRGVYRFDTVQVRQAGGFDHFGDPLEIGLFEANGRSELNAPLPAAAVLVKSGAVLRPSAGNSALVLRVSGAVTVESGATVSAVGLHNATVTSPDNAGGSHGGSGDTKSGTLGATFDSVYRPQMAGGKGYRWNWDYELNRGGGVIDIEAGALALDGNLVVTAPTATGDNYLAAAGGTVRVKAGQLSGSGIIDASGGTLVQPSTCSDNAGAGGGGRVGLELGSFSSFDPLAQVKVWGGVTDCAGTSNDRFAASGTLYYKTSSSTYGNLVIDGGDSFNSAPRRPRTTVLPALGSGNITFTAAGSDAWIVKSSPFFSEQWLGTWVELRDTAGAPLGVFQVVERDAAANGKLRLAGAGSVTGATGYRGLYRFDQIRVRRGGGLGSSDAVESADMQVEGLAALGLNPLTAIDLTVKAGATIVPASGTTRLAFKVTGAMTVEAGARIDVSGLNNATSPGTDNAGGSHGGSGDTKLGALGATFDSVYRPSLAGAKGYRWNLDNSDNRGGGVIEIEAGTLALGGEILANGKSYTVDGVSAGAGGTVWIKAGTVTGAGMIEAAGGNLTLAPSCYDYAGAGGGGRVALDVGSFSSFDPNAQARAWGGVTDCAGTTSDRFAASGTLYYKTSTSTYGNLVIDGGEAFNSAPRQPRATVLPALGSGNITFTAAGSDAWIVRSSPFFSEQWLGAWVELRDAAGAPLGIFQVVERDAAASGKLRLAGAGGVSGATGYRGLYRFDQVLVRRGAGFGSSDAIEAAAMQIEGQSAIGLNPLTTIDLTVKAGATIVPASGTTKLAFKVAGTMTVEAGAKLDVSGLNNAGAPPGIAANDHAGGSHGGGGDTKLGTLGATFDSVYRPSLAGAKGHRWNLDNTDNRGGGVIEIEAGTLALGGEILANGKSYTVDGVSAGAGGTVWVKAGTLSGAGSIEASGGNLTLAPSCHDYAGAGGGGRVALDVGSLSSFDPDSQVKTWAGVTDCSGTSGDRFAAAGTIYWKTSAATYGKLRIAGGDDWNGAARTPRATVLPALGNGTPGSVTAAGGDAWLAKSGGFPEAWLGVWVELKNGSTVIGNYQVVERDVANNRLRLADASAAAGVATNYRGFYRFDEVKLRQGSTLSGADTIEAGAYTSSWTPGQDGEEMEILASEDAAGSGAAGADGEEREGDGGEIAGRVFDDLDGDGAFGAGEPPIVGVRVLAVGASGATLAEAFTDRLGRYLLEGAPAGSAVAVDEASLPGGLSVATWRPTRERRRDFGYRQEGLALPNAAPVPACEGCPAAERATPAPPAVACSEAPFDAVFLLDLEDLGEPFAGASSRLEAAQLAFAALGRELEARGDGSRLALLTYRGAGEATEVHLLHGLSSLIDAFEDRLVGLNSADLRPGGSPAAVALHQAAGLLAGSPAAGRRPLVVWLGHGEPDVDARLRPVAGFGGALLGDGGFFPPAAEVVPQGGFSPRLGTYAGQATADAMVAIEEAALRIPGLEVAAIALRAPGGRAPGGRAPVEDLQDYAAAFTAGGRAAAADLEGLENAVLEMWKGLACAP